MIRQVGVPFVDHVQQTAAIDSHVVSCLPSVRFWQFGPTMLHLVLVITFANHVLSSRTLAGEDGWETNRGNGQRGCFNEAASRRVLNSSLSHDGMSPLREKKWGYGTL